MGCEEVELIEISSNHLKLTLIQRGYHNGDLFFLFPENYLVSSENFPISKQLTKWGILYKIHI